MMWFTETVFSTNFTTQFLQRCLISTNQFKWKYYSKRFDYVPRQTRSIMQLLTVWFPAFIEYRNLIQQRALSLKSIYRGCMDEEIIQILYFYKLNVTVCTSWFVWLLINCTIWLNILDYDYNEVLTNLISKVTIYVDKFWKTYANLSFIRIRIRIQ